MLVDVLQKLVDRGNTVIVIEHNLDLIKAADWIVDLGPEGGAGGGEIIAEGTPEEIGTEKERYTGTLLKMEFAREKAGIVEGKAERKEQQPNQTRESDQ